MSRIIVSVVISLSAFASLASASNIVVNGDFEGNWTADGPHSVPDGWTRTTEGGPDAPVIGFAVDNGPSAPGSRSAHWIRSTAGGSGRQIHFYQAVSATAADNPQLSLDVKVIRHNLSGGGHSTPAWEWPVRVRIIYTLASNPTQTQAWVHGFYLNPPGDGRVVDPGSGIIAEYEDTLVTAGVWSTHTFDLVAELPDLGEITEIRIGGAGWDWEGQVDNVVLDVQSAGCPIPGDPFTDPCVDLQAVDCAAGTFDQVCLPATATVLPFLVVSWGCACFTPGPGCGPIEIGPGLDVVSCTGTCEAPDPPDCVLFADGVSTGESTMPAIAFPTGTLLTCDCAEPLPVPPPLTAPYPHDRRKNRYISFDPNPANNGNNVAFQVELKSITLGSCNGPTGGPVDFCREDIGAADCNACSDDGNTCITAEVDCGPGQSCDPTGETCVNDAPDIGGASVGHIWWIGPEKTTSPANPNVHLLVSEPFRKVSDNWPNPVHVGDCEIVPGAVYGVRAVEVFGGAASDELVVSTIEQPAPKYWADCVGSHDGTSWSSPDNVVNLRDLTALLDAWIGFSSCPGSIADTTWVDLQGNDSFTPGSAAFDPPNYTVNPSDFSSFQEGLNGRPYEGYDPADCPDVPDWPGAASSATEDDTSWTATAGIPGVTFTDWGQRSTLMPTQRASRRYEGNRNNASNSPEISWVPVRSDGPFVLTQNGIIIPAGSAAEVEIELRVAGWGSAPGSPSLRIYQATLDGSSLLGANADPPNPGVDLVPVADPPGAFIDTDKLDFVFRNIVDADLVYTSTPNYDWSAMSGSCKSDDGVPSYYAGTFTVNVPEAAEGTYTIGFDPEARRTFLDACDCLSIPGLTLTPGTITLLATGSPLPASYPDDRRKNRYLSFDPNKAENDGVMAAFKVELKSITLGSCDGPTGGPVDFCREDRGAADCNACSGTGVACITAPIDCLPGESCDSTGETCVNDAPNSGGSNVGLVWWVGPKKDTDPPSPYIHLLVSEPFRKVSTDWPNPVHVGDCEVVPRASYGVRAVDVASGLESNELIVETTQFPPYPPPTPFWWGDAVGVLAPHCNGDIRENICATTVDCGGDPCELAWELPNGVVNFDDVTAALWSGFPGPNTVPAEVSWVDMHGNDSFTPGSQNFDPPNNKINASDLQQIISAFGGRPYTFYDPADCPDVGDWQ